MKKLVPFKFLQCLLNPLLIITLTLSSCQKDITEESIDHNQSKQKILNWLNKQKVGLTSPGVNKIQSLIEAIDFLKISVEKINENEKLYALPLNSSLKTKFDNSKPSINVLLLIENKTGNIRKGHIVKVTSDRKEEINEVVAENFGKMYKNESLVVDGDFSFLSLFGNFQFEVSYRNGNLSSTKRYEKNLPKYKKDAIQAENLSCTAWYLVTTLYLPDGTTETSEEFLYSICDDCDPGFDCEYDYIEGGGGGSVETAYEFEIARSPDWNIFPDPSGGSGQIKSLETIKGKRNPNEPQGGHFTKITHNWSICNFCSSGNPYDVWAETSNSVTASGQLATSSVTGNLSYQGVFYPGITNTKTWSFQEVFP